MLLLPLIYAPVLPLSTLPVPFAPPNSTPLSVSAFADLCFGCFTAWFDGAVRIGLRHNPVVRDRLFYGVLAGAFAHGAYLMYVFLHTLSLACAPTCSPASPCAPVLIRCRLPKTKQFSLLRIVVLAW